MSLVSAPEVPIVELVERRRERLRMALFGVPDLLPVAFRGMPPRLQQLIAGSARSPLPVLLRASDLRRFLARVDEVCLLVAFGQAVSRSALAAVRTELGESADDPSECELRAALDVVLQSVDPRVVAVMLATVAASEANSAALCDAVLDTDLRFQFAPVDLALDGPPAIAVQVSPEVPRDQSNRRVRRRPARSVATPRPSYRRRRTTPAANAAVEEVGQPDVVLSCESAPSRRRPPLTPAEAQRFNPDHPLVGSVVIADVWYDAIDPNDPGCLSKRRPCVVVGVSPTQLLVRPGYSAGGFKTRTWKSVELRDWEAAGLARATWIEAKTRQVRRTAGDHVLGRLTDEDWNSLF